MIKQDTWSYFDSLIGKNIMGWQDPYGVNKPDMLWAWIPCAFAFVLAGLGESFLAF